MTDAAIHVFNHRAMATLFQARIAGEEKQYAAQSAQATFGVVDHLEGLLSRFRESSEISRIAHLVPGETLRLSEPVFACLECAQRMESATRGAFSISAAALRTQAVIPRWSLDRASLSIRCENGRLEFDLGAIGKGFALDRMAEELVEWGCPSFLLVAGGSSILVSAAPGASPGWSVGLGDDNAEPRYWLTNASLSGSGIAVKGEHIFDPRTGAPVRQRSRAWALASTAAESDALSTACMVLSETEIADVVGSSTEWKVFLYADGDWRQHGARVTPQVAVG
jgi:thiamine biosynthesis lipoprotein